MKKQSLNHYAYHASKVLPIIKSTGKQTSPWKHFSLSYFPYILWTAGQFPSLYESTPTLSLARPEKKQIS